MAAKGVDSITLYRQVLNEIKKGELNSVYFLHGSDSYFPDQLQEAFINTIPEETRDFNLDVFYARETTLNQVLAAARSFPMMAERRMVIVRDFHHYFDPSRRDKSESNREDLTAYVQQPNPTTVLVIIDEKGPDQKTKLGKALKESESAAIYKFEPVSEDNLPQWIEEWAKQTREKEFEPRASQLLAFHVGNNLLSLVAEIEKLCTYTRESVITPEDVKEVVGITREAGIFELSDALTAGDRSKVLAIAEQMIQQADNATGEIFKTLGYLTVYFTNLWQMHRLLQKGVGDREVPKKIGMNPYFYKNLKPALKVYPAHRIPLIFEALLDADRSLKGFSSMSPEAVFLMTIKRITS